MTEAGTILAHLDRDAIEVVCATAPGNELASGQFLSKESSAALAADEPEPWPDGCLIEWSQIERHRQEFQYFGHSVRDDEVQFTAVSHQDLLANWRSGPDPEVTPQSYESIS